MVIGATLSVSTAQHALEIDEDLALVHSAKEGDTSAFEQLIKRHTSTIFRVAMHITSSREDSEDIVQDAFLKAFRSIHRFEERARFSTWLTRIAVNEALIKLRGSRRALTISIDEETDDSVALADRVADWRPDPEQLYSTAELRAILQQALASLPDSYRVVFLLRDVEGLSIAETAEMLGLCVSNVKARLFRARLKLRKHLSQHFEHGEMGTVSSLPLKQFLGALRTSPVEI
jgi:RNA polymerase sigma-70 factor (ECF subfamily)